MAQGQGRAAGRATGFRKCPGVRKGTGRMLGTESQGCKQREKTVGLEVKRTMRRGQRLKVSITIPHVKSLR